MVSTVLAYMFYLSPYVFCIWFLLENITIFLRTRQERKMNENRRTGIENALFILSMETKKLAVELKRLNNRVECKACPGKENTEDK